MRACSISRTRPRSNASRRCSRDFGLESVADTLAESLPLGIRQRLSLAVAVIHEPEMLILDEPTSGVDPVARDGFWELLIRLSRENGVTIFLSTHFMNEAERCDRMSMMHAGKVLAQGPPAQLVAERKAKNLEEAFIGYLEEAAGQSRPYPATGGSIVRSRPRSAPVHATHGAAGAEQVQLRPHLGVCPPRGGRVAARPSAPGVRRPRSAAADDGVWLRNLTRRRPPAVRRAGFRRDPGQPRIRR